MLRGWKHGHIHPDFRDDSDSCKGLDTRRRHNRIELGKILLGERQDQGLQIELAQLETIHMGADDAELFSLFFTPLTIHSGEHQLIGCFHSSGSEAGNIGDFLCWVFQDSGGNCRSCLSKHICEHIIQLEVGDCQTILCPIFLTGCKVGELPAAANQVSKLPEE